MSTLSDLAKLLKQQKKTGSDYIGTVTRVDGGTAYVQLAGSEITDTPVSMSIDCKAGDKVRVRVSGGRAWITGNDTLPPANSKKEVATKMSKDMADRDRDIVIEFGSFSFKGNTLVVDSRNFKLNKKGDAVFSGELEAAGGTFGGAVRFQWLDYAFPEYVYIGDKTKGAPLLVTGESETLGTVDAAIQAGYFEASRGGGNVFYAITPDGPSRGSDKRLKDDIQELSAEIGQKLHPVSYRYKVDGKNAKRYGFIAQEVKELIPDAVQENERGYLGLNYTELIAPILALAQRNARRIEELEEEIKALKGDTE